MHFLMYNVYVCMFNACQYDHHIHILLFQPASMENVYCKFQTVRLAWLP